MGLSRLDNFLKSARGAIIYVDPNSLDATDSIENQGNSLTRPFKTLQRALIESARFSYQRGLDNDRFEKTTIVLYPGDHVVDNRPGYIPDGAGNFRLRSGTTSADFPPFDLTSIFDLADSNNILYKFNSIHGGVIIPRGTSIVGMDLRKTRIRPLYVPDPSNSNIERSAIFRITGACYFWQFTFLDADPNGICYKDYTNNQFVPNFSHHKLTAFEYADGVNNININDAFQTYSTDRTDLDVYYEKVGLAYGPASGREIQPDYPSSGLDIQPKIDEYRIVGSRGAEVGISSIRSGDGVLGTTTITVTLSDVLPGLDVDTPIQISGVSAAGYDGQYVVSEVLSPIQIQYKVQNVPTQTLPTVSGATLNINVDTVTSASPYIFNISLRSVYGMCGLHADGDKAEGFKSMVVAQFTGIGLQKDNNAFVKYNTTSGVYEDLTAPGNENIHADSLARFKPEYENYHIKCSNDAYLQLVSVFAIGYANHFLAESGGDQSINNSNSNFGAKALVASGFRRSAFPRDDVGYITHLIPPKIIETSETTIEYYSIDVDKTVSTGITSRLYLYNQTNQAVPPDSVIDGFRVGSKVNDNINVLINQNGTSTEYLAKIIMPNTTSTSSEKVFYVGRSQVGINSISSNTITFTQNHDFLTGETVRVISNTGQLPDGIINNQVYYAITNTVAGIGSNQVRLAQTLNDANGNVAITLNNKGGILKVVSRVSDKKSGDIGHPVQYDSSISNWYINVSSNVSENTIYPTVSSLGTGSLGSATPRTYIKRKPDTRNLSDTIYRYRYVIPADSPVVARPPLDGYVIQESNTSIGSTNSEVSYQFSPTSISLSNSTELRNQKIISNASWNGSTTATITTELPHELSVGSEVEVLNVTTTTNTTGIANSAFNGTFEVTEILNSRQFRYSLTSSPGTFTNNTSIRTVSLPHIKKKKYKDTYIIYRSQEVQKYVPGNQDGIYNLFVVNCSNSPSVTPFNDLKFFQPIQNLYPQTNRDNPVSDPSKSRSFALSSPVGQVVIDDPQHSLTRETIEKNIVDNGIGIGITNIISNSAGTAHTIYTSIDHGFNRIISLTIKDGGTNYVPGTYYGASLVGLGGSIVGSYANARVTVNASGIVTDVKIMHGGSAYGIGNSLALTGVAATTGNTQALLEVSKIYNNTNDVISIFGIDNITNENYNSLYRITAINGEKELIVSSASTISSASTTGLGSTVLSSAQLYLVGSSIDVLSFTYSNISGIATVVTVQNHGLIVDNSVTISGADNSFFNGNFVVKKVDDLITFTINVGTRTDNPSTSGNILVFPTGLSANGGNVSLTNENLGGRSVVEYAGITTTVSTGITTTTTDIIIANVDNYDLNVGDYLQIDEEIMRVKSTVVGNPVTVFRGVLGTRKTFHQANSVIRRIKPRPIELRRNSLIRASGHTFEYLGFGPGNYSTAFPERQNRTVGAAEELLAQSTKSEGGIVVFTGMNADGDFYVGNKKVNSSTGQEEVFDAPIPTVTGEDPGVGGINLGFDVLTPLEASISRSLRVEGGPDANLISEFDGPVIFNNKITSTSEKGIEAASLFLQGDSSVSRKYTVGISVPTLAGNPGDIVYESNPQKTGTIGWVYTTENDWYRFGNISISKEYNYAIFDKVGIATTSVGNYSFVVGSGSSIFEVDGSGVGIGTTSNSYKLNVLGTTNIEGATTLKGNLTVNGIISGTFALDPIWQNDGVGISTIAKVGIGTTVAKTDNALYVNGNTRIDGVLNVFEIIEKATINTTPLTGTVNIDLLDNNVFYFTSNATGNWNINFRGNISTTLNDFLKDGESVTVAIITTQGSTPYYNNNVLIESNLISAKYYGGVKFNSGNTNSIDVYTYVIIKISSGNYTVLCSQSQYA